MCVEPSSQTAGQIPGAVDASPTGRADGASRAALADRARRELVGYVGVSAYLYVCFAAVLFYKSAILSGHGVTYDHFGLAAAKALILGKFILVGNALSVGQRRTAGRLIFHVLYKSVSFLLLLFLLNILEEVCVGLFHGRTPGSVIGGFIGPQLPQTLANSILVLLILIPYIAVQEASRRMPKGEMINLIFGRPPGTDVPRPTASAIRPRAPT
jgi:hypothetical protein